MSTTGTKEYNTTEDVAENRSACHMKTMACPLLHGGGLRGDEKKCVNNRICTRAYFIFDIHK